MILMVGDNNQYRPYVPWAKQDETNEALTETAISKFLTTYLLRGDTSIDKQDIVRKIDPTLQIELLRGKDKNRVKWAFIGTAKDYIHEIIMSKIEKNKSLEQLYIEDATSANNIQNEYLRQLICGLWEEDTIYPLSDELFNKLTSALERSTKSINKDICPETQEMSSEYNEPMSKEPSQDENLFVQTYPIRKHAWWERIPSLNDMIVKIDPGKQLQLHISWKKQEIETAFLMKAKEIIHQHVMDRIDKQKETYAQYEKVAEDIQYKYFQQLCDDWRESKSYELSEGFLNELLGYLEQEQTEETLLQIQRERQIAERNNMLGNSFEDELLALVNVIEKYREHGATVRQVTIWFIEKIKEKRDMTLTQEETFHQIAQEIDRQSKENKEEIESKEIV